MAYKLDATEHWINDKLTADAEIVAAGFDEKVYRDQAPDDAEYPFIVFSFQAGADVNAVGTARILTRPIYQIKVISKGAPDATARLLANRIDEIFQNAVAETHSITRTESGGNETESYTFSSRRIEPVSYTENEQSAKQLYYHRGGLYRIEVSD